MAHGNTECFLLAFYHCSRNKLELKSISPIIVISDTNFGKKTPKKSFGLTVLYASTCDRSVIALAPWLDDTERWEYIAKPCHSSVRKQKRDNERKTREPHNPLQWSIPITT